MFGGTYEWFFTINAYSPDDRPSRCVRSSGLDGQFVGNFASFMARFFSVSPATMGHVARSNETPFPTARDSDGKDFQKKSAWCRDVS